MNPLLARVRNGAINADQIGKTVALADLTDLENRYRIVPGEPIRKLVKSNQRVMIIKYGFLVVVVILLGLIAKLTL
jgi:hypothetical protein